MEAAHYHAGMSAEDRQEVQRAWAANEINIICATIAFGMGNSYFIGRCGSRISTPGLAIFFLHSIRQTVRHQQT
jgi:hypothetical protein